MSEFRANYFRFVNKLLACETEFNVFTNLLTSG